MLRTFQTSLTLSQVLSFDILSMVNKKRTTVRQPKEEILYFDKKTFLTNLRHLIRAFRSLRNISFARRELTELFL